jgi:hypothetical protein
MVILFARSGGQARRRIQGIIGVSPVFPISTNGDDQSLKTDLPAGYEQISSSHSAAQAGTPMILFARLRVRAVRERSVLFNYP